MTRAHKLAKKITLNQETKQIFIDDELFPYYITPGVEVSDLLDKNAIPTVHISIFAETVEVIPEAKVVE